jgi:hypothetical protein
MPRLTLSEAWRHHPWPMPLDEEGLDQHRDSRRASLAVERLWVIENAVLKKELATLQTSLTEKAAELVAKEEHWSVLLYDRRVGSVGKLKRRHLAAQVPRIGPLETNPFPEHGGIGVPCFPDLCDEDHCTGAKKSVCEGAGKSMIGPFGMFRAQDCGAWVCSHMGHATLHCNACSEQPCNCLPPCID